MSTTISPNMTALDEVIEVEEDEGSPWSTDCTNATKESGVNALLCDHEVKIEHRSVW
jgi:hypothetical protein